MSAKSLDASATISGTLTAATRIEGSNLSLTVWGANLARLFDFIGVAIPDTRHYPNRSALTYGNEAWQLTRMRGLIGESDVAGTLKVSQPDGRLHLGADLTTQSLSIIDAGPFIGYDPNRLATRGLQGAYEDCPQRRYIA